MVALYFHMLAYLALRLRDPLRIIVGVMLIVALATLFAARHYQRRVVRPAGKLIPFPQRRQEEQRRAA